MPPAPRTRTGPGWPVVLAALAYGACVIAWSFWVGRLAAPPGYDDVAYFVQAQTLLLELREDGIAGLLAALVDQPPHSPFSVGAAFVAFLVFGVRDWAPYVTNLAIVVLALGLVLRRVPHERWGVPHERWGVPRERWGVPHERWLRAYVVLLVLSFPVTAMAVHEFRPDLLAALLTAAAAVTAVEAMFGVGEAGRRVGLRPGAWLGAALLVKPSAAPFTLLVTACALASGGVAATLARRDGRLGPRVGAAAQALGLGLLLFSPYLALNGPGIARYTFDAVVRDRALWGRELPLVEALEFYLVGHGGHTMMGGHVYLAAAHVAAATWLLARRSRAALAPWAALLGVAFVAWLLPTLSQNRTHFLGATWYCLFLYAGLQGSLVVYRALAAARPQLARPYLGAVAVAALLCFAPPPAPRRGAITRLSESARHFPALVGDVERACAASGAHPCRVAVLFTGDVCRDNLLFELRRRGLGDVQVEHLFLRPDDDAEARILTLIDRSHVVLASDPSGGAVDTHLVLGQRLDVSLRLIAARPRLELVSTYPFRSGGELRLYADDAWPPNPTAQLPEATAQLPEATAQLPEATAQPAGASRAGAP